MKQQMESMPFQRRNSFLVNANEAYISQINYNGYLLIYCTIFSSQIKQSQSQEKD